MNKSTPTPQGDHETAGDSANGVGHSATLTTTDWTEGVEVWSASEVVLSSNGGNVRQIWWHEVAYVGIFYGAYTFIRNQFGSASVGAVHASNNAHTIIKIEKKLGIFNEAILQHHFLDWGWFLRFWNIFYGSLHFIVPVGILTWLFYRYPKNYRLWRTSLLATTGLALIGFSLFPLMPPRLLCDCPPHGAGSGFDYGFVDTLAIHGGLWSFGSSTMESISNQYAAMPSLHVAWALWCALALWPRVKHWWTRALVILFPLATTFAVVVTANHFWLDVAGGVAVMGMGHLLAIGLTRFIDSRRSRAPHGRAVMNGVP